MISTFALSAQVKNGAYNLLLKTMLNHSVSEISVDEIRTVINEKQDYLILDTRELNEYNVSHVPGAIWVGYEDFSLERIPVNTENKAVVVYCSVGYRSEKIAEQLVGKGYSNVQNLYGGIFEYVNSKYTLHNNAGNVTDSIHAFNKKWGVWLSSGVKVYE